MAPPLQSAVRNQLLKALPSADFRVLQNSLEAVALKLGDVMAEVNKPIEFIISSKQASLPSWP